MTQYPEPEGPPGAPFEDPNFKLVILENLLDQELIDLGTPQELATHLLGREVDLDKEGYELIPQCLRYLHRYPLSRELLQRVSSVIIDGGLEIYEFAFMFWSGESDVFDIQSLGGIEHCPNVTSYWESAMCADSDLSRLAQLRKLESISLALRSGTHQYRSLDSLLSLPSLQLLELCKSTVEQLAADDIIGLFESKGIKVKVFAC